MDNQDRHYHKRVRANTQHRLSGLAESELVCDVAADRGLPLANAAIRAVASGPPSSSGNQASLSRVNLGTCVLSSNRQRGQVTDLKESPWTPANYSGKRNLAVMQEADQPYSSDKGLDRQWNVACKVGGQWIPALRLNRTHSIERLI